LTIVKVNNVLQYWGKQEVREIRWKYMFQLEMLKLLVE
jgi:hypothetical protein